MNITINYTTLYETVERSLSIIAKRSLDDKGNLLFADMTLGTREQELITDYIHQAVLDIVAETEAFITGSTDNTQVTLTFPTNHNSQLEPFIQKSCDAYCVSYALYTWFFIVYPRIATQYADDCKRQLATVIRLVNEKKAPENSTDILSTSTNVT